MIIERKYKFYAAHRNQLLVDTKCERLHGHRYGLDIGFGVRRDRSNASKGAVTTLFEELDFKANQLIERLDHRTLCDLQDSELRDVLRTSMDLLERDHVYLPYPTSVENVSHFIFGCLTTLFFPATSYLWVEYIRLQETDSAIIVYTKQDWVDDHQLPFNPIFRPLK